MCQMNMNSLDDYLELDDFDIPAPPPPPKAKAPPSLNEGLWISQGGAAVAKASSGSLVTVGSRPTLPKFLSPDVIGEAAKQAAGKGGIIVIIPPNLDVTGIRLSIDGGASICRGSFCSGTGSAPMTDEGIPISAANSSASFIFPAPARIPVVVHPVASRSGGSF